MALLEVMKVKQQEGSFSMLNAGLLAAETDYTKYKEMTNKEKRALLFSCYNSSLESLCLYENW